MQREGKMTNITDFITIVFVQFFVFTALISPPQRIPLRSGPERRQHHRGGHDQWRPEEGHHASGIDLQEPGPVEQAVHTAEG